MKIFQIFFDEFHLLYDVAFHSDDLIPYFKTEYIYRLGNYLFFWATRFDCYFNQIVLGLVPFECVWMILGVREDVHLLLRCCVLLLMRMLRKVL